MRSWFTILMTVLFSETSYAGMQMSIIFSGYPSGKETLTNFPALVTFTNGIPLGFSYSQFSSTNGYDIRFYSGITELNYGIDTWNPSGQSFVWVQVPSLTNGTIITAQWGNPSKTQADYTTNGATWWTNYYRAVYHMNSGSDSSYYRNNGYPSNGIVLGGTNGLVGKATEFIRLNTNFITVLASDSLSFTNGPSSDYPFTLSSLFNPRRVENFRIAVRIPEWAFVIRPVAGFGRFCAFIYQSDSGMNVSVQEGSMYAYSNQWVHGLSTYDGRGGYPNPPPTNGMANYVNGYIIPNSTGCLSSVTRVYTNMLKSSVSLQIGNLSGTDGADGFIDEIRLSQGVRSTNWIWAEWFNMVSNTAFQTYYSVRSVGGVPYYRNQLGYESGL